MSAIVVEVVVAARPSSVLARTAAAASPSCGGPACGLARRVHLACRRRARASRPRRTTARPPAPATTTPSQTLRGEDEAGGPVGDRRRRCRPSLRVPVSQAATGTSVQASPRSPAARPRRRQATKLSAAPSSVSTRARAAQVAESSMASLTTIHRARLSLRSGLERIGDMPDALRSPTPGLRRRRRASRRPRSRPPWRRTTRRRGPDAAEALVALRTARLLVPVVAVLGEVEDDEHGLAHDKTSDMAAVLMTGRGRPDRAAGVHRHRDAWQPWNPEARPVPVPAAAGGAGRGPGARRRRCSSTWPAR